MTISHPLVMSLLPIVAETDRPTARAFNSHKESMSRFAA